MSTKQFEIPKRLIWEAWKQVRSNKGGSGVDRESLEVFESKLKSNLYKIWNRMSSGSYFPSPVKAVAIPKKSGGERILGVPTVSDRVAQTAVKNLLESDLDKIFLPDSYGYRPNKSAHQAIAVTRQRCWKYSWVLEFDIKGLFDEIPHDLLLKALKLHTDSKWVILYIERWLRAPMLDCRGSTIERKKGTPQGGCISPLLSNLFLHYAFDKWMRINHPGVLWCRFADDGLIHCKSENQAKMLLHKLTTRFAECGLEIHPLKTRIIYCSDSRKRLNKAPISFKFLGYEFKERLTYSPKNKTLFMKFQPAISNDTLKSMRNIIKRQWRLGFRVDKSLEDLASEVNPVVRGWLNYYGLFNLKRLQFLALFIDKQLMKWARNKYKSLQRNYNASRDWLKSVFSKNPKLFAHWSQFHVY